MGDYHDVNEQLMEYIETNSYRLFPEILEDKLADVNYIDSYDETPLIKAIRLERNEIVLLLLDSKEIDVNYVNKYDTALIQAIDCYRNDYVYMLLERPEINVNLQTKTKGSALIRAIERRNDIALKMLLSRSDLNVNITDLDSDTGLMVAYYMDNLNAIKLLLTRRDIDLFQRDEEGKTIFDIVDDDDRERPMLDDYLLLQSYEFFHEDEYQKYPLITQQEIKSILPLFGETQLSRLPLELRYILFQKLF